MLILRTGLYVYLISLYKVLENRLNWVSSPHYISTLLKALHPLKTEPISLDPITHKSGVHWSKSNCEYLKK